ncbi:MAG: hypothetical protein QXJ21_04280 [Thermofilum sp.]
MIVVNASVLAKCLLREPGCGSVEGYLLEGACSVDRAVKGVAGALWRRVFYGRIPFESARELCRALTMPI